jgi:hypothetical protein
MTASAHYESLMKRWTVDGTFDRLDAAFEQRTRVQIKRSSGEFVTGIIACIGHQGLSCVVAWGDDLDGVRLDVGADRVHLPADVSGKKVTTEALLGWNPSLAGVTP